MIMFNINVMRHHGDVNGSWASSVGKIKSILFHVFFFLVCIINPIPRHYLLQAICMLATYGTIRSVEENNRVVTLRISFLSCYMFYD